MQAERVCQPYRDNAQGPSDQPRVLHGRRESHQASADVDLQEVKGGVPLIILFNFIQRLRFRNNVNEGNEQSPPTFILS